MKKMKLIAVAFVGALALASCTKDYNCVCTSNAYAGGKATVATYSKVSKSDAESGCSSSETTIKLVNADVKCAAEVK